MLYEMFVRFILIYLKKKKKRKKKRFQSNFLIPIYFSLYIFIIYTYIFETEIFLDFSGKHYSYNSTWKNFISALESASSIVIFHIFLDHHCFTHFDFI